MVKTYPILKRGDTGSSVEALQKQLANWWGIPCSVDGVFGYNTEAAVKQFQAMRQTNHEYAGKPLAQDGVVGRATWAELYRMSITEIAKSIVKKPEVQLEIQNRKISSEAIELIEAFEGLRLKAYHCAAGTPTIGIGHIEGVHIGMTITKEQAYTFFREDVQRFEKAVSNLITVPLTDRQFGALVSFAFNLGEGALEKSTLRKKLNSGDYNGAANEFPKWCKAAGKTLPGLIRRRSAEMAMFKGENFRQYL